MESTRLGTIKSPIKRASTPRETNVNVFVSEAAISVLANQVTTAINRLTKMPSELSRSIKTLGTFFDRAGIILR
jgi:hypothetical protein